MWKKYKEILLYLIFGGLTTVVSIVIYWLLTEVLPMDPLAANIISWIGAVTFAYGTNRTWVFESRASGTGQILKEAASFYGGRLITLGLEELMLLVGIRLLELPNMPVKLVAQVLVIVLNYVISKLFVFHKKP